MAALAFNAAPPVGRVYQRMPRPLDSNSETVAAPQKFCGVVTSGAARALPIVTVTARRLALSQEPACRDA
jgi:hypothetical protein